MRAYRITILNKVDYATVELQFIFDVRFVTYSLVCTAYYLCIIHGMLAWLTVPKSCFMCVYFSCI